MVVNASSLNNSSYISKNLKLIDLKYISKQLHLMLACLTLSLIHKMQINLHLLSWKLKNLLPKREIIKEGKERLINSLSLHNNNRNHSRNSALSKYSENKIDGIFVATWRLARGINEYKTPFAWCHRDKYHMSMGAFIWQIQKHTSINLLSKVALQQQKNKAFGKEKWLYNPLNNFHTENAHRHTLSPCFNMPQWFIYACVAFFCDFFMIDLLERKFAENILNFVSFSTILQTIFESHDILN